MSSSTLLMYMSCRLYMGALNEQLAQMTYDAADFLDYAHHCLQRERPLPWGPEQVFDD